MTWPALLVIGAALIALPEFVSFGLHLPSGTAAAAGIARARQVYGHEGFLAILRFRWHESWSLIVPLLTSVLSRSTGLMCWGMAAWRCGILRQPNAHRFKLGAMLAIGLSLGGALTVNQIQASSCGRAFWPAM